MAPRQGSIGSIDDYGSERRLLSGCCSQVNHAEGMLGEITVSSLRTHPTPEFEKLQRNIEDTMQQHFSKQEKLLQKLFDKIMDSQSLTEPEEKLDLKAQERSHSTGDNLAEVKYLDSSYVHVDFHDDMEMPGSFDLSRSATSAAHLVSKAAEEAIVPVHDKLAAIEIMLAGMNKQHDRVHKATSESSFTEVPSQDSGEVQNIVKMKSHPYDRTTTLLSKFGYHKAAAKAEAVASGRSTSSLKFEDFKVNSEDRFGCKTYAVFRLVKFIEWWENLHEPPRTGKLARFTGSKSFESICAIVILTNAVFTLFATNWEMDNLGADPTLFMNVAEYGFLGFYTIELVLKLLVHRLFFFSGSDLKWNSFDLFLVVFSIYDQLVVPTIKKSEGGGVNLTFMRSFRVFKMAKILRAVRAMRFITQLRLMLNSILGSFISLFWSFVMLLFIFYIFSLIFVQGCITFLLNSEQSESPMHASEYSLLMKYFGSVEECIMTLIQATTGGNDWSVFYDALSPSGTSNCALFIFFIGFFQIALLNVLTGIFVENAMKLAQPDPYTVALEQRKMELLEAAELRHVCRDLENPHSGKISPEDFEKGFHSGKLRAHLRVLGLDIKDTQKFFSVLSATSGENEIDIETFVNGCMKLKGQATAIDLQSLWCETREALMEIQKLAATRTMRRHDTASLSLPGSLSQAASGSRLNLAEAEGTVSLRPTRYVSETGDRPARYVSEPAVRGGDS